MRYRRLGETGLEVSVLGYGASALGAMYRDIDELQGVRAVHEAVAAGINYVDVSPYYGLTKAETLLGKAISDLPRHALILSSKAGRYGAHQFDMSTERVLRSVDESLARLHTDYLDILFLHDIEFVPFQQVLEEGIPALIKLKEQGKIRFAGVSGLPLTALLRATDCADLDVVLSYCHYSLCDTSLLRALPSFANRQVGVVNASPLAMGLLTTRGAPDWHPAGPKIREVCAEAVAFCEEAGVDLSQLAMQFAVQAEAIPTTLFSTANPENVKKNIEWIDEPMDQSALDSVLAILRPIHDMTWPSGLAEYEQ